MCNTNVTGATDLAAATNVTGATDLAAATNVTGATDATDVYRVQQLEHMQQV